MKKGTVLLFVAVSMVLGPSRAASAEDAFSRWQQQDARSELIDEEKNLLKREDEMKRSLYELDQSIAEAQRKRAFMLEDLRNLQRDIVSVKMRLM